MNHSFDLDIAKEYGIEEAIILSHLYFWLKKNEGNDTNYHDGKYWTYNSVKSFNDYFYYMTPKRIRNALDHLINEGLILTGNYNKTPYDRTRWYAITDKGKALIMRETVETVELPKGQMDLPKGQMELPKGQMDLPKGQMDLTKRANGFIPRGKPIPDNNTYSIPYSVPNNKPNRKTVATVIDSVPLELQEPVKDFVEMRKTINKKMSPRALEIMLTKLNNLSNGDIEISKQILNQSIEHSWQTVYPLKEEKTVNKSNPYLDYIEGENNESFRNR